MTVSEAAGPEVSTVTRRRHRYGRHPSQVADLWRDERHTTDVPVVLLLHGGFWRFAYTKRLMNGLAAAIAAQGVAVWNVEYRRLGPPGGGWPDTFDDVEAALDYLVHLEGLDRSRVVTCGHSAGGHLALWLAARSVLRARNGEQSSVRVRGALSLAGISDLATAQRLGLGGGAVDLLLGGGARQVSARFAASSPFEMLPLGLPQVLVHGLADTVVPASMSERYCERALMLGDSATYVPLTGVGHRELIDPHSSAWVVALGHLEVLIS